MSEEPETAARAAPVVFGLLMLIRFTIPSHQQTLVPCFTHTRHHIPETEVVSNILLDDHLGG